MGTIIIFGAGSLGKSLYPEIEASCNGEIIFADSNPALKDTRLFGKKVISPTMLPMITYDKIIITSVTGYKTISSLLINDYKIPPSKIDTHYVCEIYERTYGARNRFLKRFAQTVYSLNLKGNIVEGGVYEGSFAKQLNAVFPDRLLYLFDTFEGFDLRDVNVENGEVCHMNKHFMHSMTEHDIINLMPYPDKIITKKGYFPETFVNIDDKFVFVNLDFDLYKPTLAGLELFYPNIVSGGVILIHDYFTDAILVDNKYEFTGVKQAVDEFCALNNIYALPIADEMSVAIIKS